MLFRSVCCLHVLQRLPPAEGLRLIRQLFDLVGTGGVGIFQLPFRTTVGAGVRLSRWLRARVPIVNGLINQRRGRPWTDPYIPTHVYNLDSVLNALDWRSAAAAQLVFDHQEDLESAVFFVEKPLPSITGVDGKGRPITGRTLRSLSADPESAIDVKALIARSSIDALNASAEEYFASLNGWDDHLAKPFATVGDAPKLLANLSSLLSGLQLRPGDTVLDFGAGTGWISRQLTQLGCRAILLDVSPTGLEIAKELYRRLPIVGERPAPQFVAFDGRRIDVPDGTVDRILCFDALHHAPNPDQVLSEFGRILKPGGIAGFSEPGARHSMSAMSQYEMRTHGVVENDVDIHALWRTAQAQGFADLKIMILNGPPFYVSLAEYEDFLAGGQTGERWATATRVHQRNTRVFFLTKAGVETLDSRSVAGLAAHISVDQAPSTALEGEPLELRVSAANAGRAAWLASDVAPGGVSIGAHVYDASDRLLALGHAIAPLVGPGQLLAPGGVAQATLRLPGLAPGRYRLEIDCVAEKVAWFSQAASSVASVAIEVVPRG